MLLEQSLRKPVLMGVKLVHVISLLIHLLTRWRGNSWEKLLEDYHLLKGKVWVLIPVWIALAPIVL